MVVWDEDRASPDETSDPIYSYYLADFDRHLDGEILRNSQPLLKRIALSLRRIISETYAPRISRLFNIVGVAERSLYTLDGLSDRY